MECCNTRNERTAWRIWEEVSHIKEVVESSTHSFIKSSFILIYSCFLSFFSFHSLVRLLIYDPIQLFIFNNDFRFFSHLFSYVFMRSFLVYWLRLFIHLSVHSFIDLCDDLLILTFVPTHSHSTLTLHVSLYQSFFTISHLFTYLIIHSFIHLLIGSWNYMDSVRPSLFCIGELSIASFCQEREQQMEINSKFPSRETSDDKEIRLSTFYWNGLAGGCLFDSWRRSCPSYRCIQGKFLTKYYYCY